ncbi:MAG: NAD(P)H-binding protein [Betaproteobacteria bacterium]|nr:NAD(P)H-binding protein [Betaproteobacteria bacterium]
MGYAVSRVVLTGATGQVGRATITALIERGPEPTALVRSETTLEGCVTVSKWLASNEAVAAIRRAEIIVHLAGTLNPPDHDYERANIVPAARVAKNLDPARVRRLIFLSYVGASEQSPNPYLAAKARTERLLTETGVPVTIFRCTHIIGSPDRPGPTAGNLLLDGKRAVTVLGSGRQRVAPVFLGDVVAALLVAMDSERSGTFDLQGPEEMSMDDLVRLLNWSDSVPIRHIPGPVSRLLRFIGPKLPGALIDVMLQDCRSERPTAAQAFGLSLTPLARVWGRDG